MTFVLLIYRARSPAEPLPAGREEAALAAHRALQTEVTARAELHAVAQLGDARRARTVRSKDGAHDVTDGPYVETKEWLVGFYLMDCSSEDEALARARRLLPDDSHAIEVRPVVWMRRP